MNRFFLCLITIFLCSSSLTWAWPAKVVRIIDGDTMVVQSTEGQQVRIRLYGIDCPEIGQAFGREAAGAAQALALGRQVDIEETGQDHYKRTVAIVRLQNSVTLQEALIKAGVSWVYPRYCKRVECETWREKERDARAAGMGLWINPEPTTPWVWRRSARTQ